MKEFPMKELLRGEDRIQKICDALKKETLDPAKKEAALMIAEAEKKALHILEEAKKEEERMYKSAKEAIEKERLVFHSSLEHAGRQVFEVLKQSIEKKLFDESLAQLTAKESQDVSLIAKLMTTLVRAIDREGLKSDLQAEIPASIHKEEVIQHLSVEIQNRFKEKDTLILDGFSGGFKLRLKDKKLNLDFSDDALCQLLSNYVRKDFRKFVFQKGV
jgi:V/A-type H+/Na+-transporting ATPase subunit E